MTGQVGSKGPSWNHSTRSKTARNRFQIPKSSPITAKYLRRVRTVMFQVLKNLLLSKTILPQLLKTRNTASSEKGLLKEWWTILRRTNKALRNWTGRSRTVARMPNWTKAKLFRNSLRRLWMRRWFKSRKWSPRALWGHQEAKATLGGVGRAS